jgi:hypothetical protein
VSRWVVGKFSDGYRVVLVPDDFDRDRDCYPPAAVTASRVHSTLESARIEWLERVPRSWSTDEPDPINDD